MRSEQGSTVITRRLGVIDTMTACIGYAYIDFVIFIRKVVQIKRYRVTVFQKMGAKSNLYSNASSVSKRRNDPAKKYINQPHAR